MASRQAQHQAKKRLKGLCSYGGCNDYTGMAYRCLKHERAHKVRMRATREATKQVEPAPSLPPEEQAA